MTVTVAEPQPEPIVYTLTTEGEISWAKASKVDLVLTVKRSEADETCFDHFTGVMIDGVLLEKDKDYTAAAGSTVITLKAAALQKLNVGKHTVKVLFDDGEAEAPLKVLSASGTTTSSTTSRTTTSRTTRNTAAKTGDTRSAALWAVVFALGLCGVVCTAGRLKKER